MPRSVLCGACSKQDLATALKPPMVTNRALAVWRGSHILDFRLHCSFCKFLFELLNVKDPMPLKDVPYWKYEYVYLYATSKDDEPGVRVEVTVGDADMASAITLIRSQPVLERRPSILLLPGASAESLQPISGRILGDSVSWPLVRGWFNHCVSTHKHHTPSNIQGSGFQTRKWASCFRLVDVRRKCVVEAPMSLPYAALSYVWGKSKSVQLNQQNTKELKAEGGLDKLDYLPQTFRDAICITQNLGLAHLWIDALCIQHDDDADRSHQINAMDQIYQGSAITIVSVTSNADCHIPGVIPDTRNTTSLRYDATGIDLMYARPDLKTAIAQSEWESRGWTLQEKFFSKRLLYFTTDQVFFRCSDAVWAEDALLEPPTFQECFDSAVDFTYVNPALIQNSGPDLHTPTVLESFFEYQDLLKQYVTRNLTRDTDIVAAFGGILNSFEHRLGVSAFGLPELVFDAALLWVGDPRVKRRPGFPSWSWCGWKLGRVPEISWLVVSSDDDEDQAWAWSATPKLMEIHHLILEDRRGPSRIFETMDYTNQAASESDILHAKFVIPLPRPLKLSKAKDSVSSHTLISGLSRTAQQSKPSHILEFECDTFFDAAYIIDDVKIALDESLECDREQGRPPPHRLDFLVMSGSRVNDTWYKRRQGTYLPPPAPRWYLKQATASVNTMLIRTDESGISERICIFSIVMKGQLPETVRKTILLA